MACYWLSCSYSNTMLSRWQNELANTVTGALILAAVTSIFYRSKESSEHDTWTAHRCFREKVTFLLGTLLRIIRYLHTGSVQAEKVLHRQAYENSATRPSFSPYVTPTLQGTPLRSVQNAQASEPYKPPDIPEKKAYAGKSGWNPDSCNYLHSHAKW